MNSSSSTRGRLWWHRLISRAVRRAHQMRVHVWRLLNEQRDLLAPEAIAAVEKADRKLAALLSSTTNAAEIEKGAGEFETLVNERLLAYPHGAVRENTKEILVAITIVFAFTTFFLQLTKIPTNSLLPTLYGITSEDLRKDPGFKIPGQIERLWEYWVHGASYYQVTAQADGMIQSVEEPQFVLPFVKKQRIRVGPVWYTIWFPPDKLAERAGLRPDQFFHAGDDVIKLKVVAGDHLLVDRISYNFRRPRRGEIFVFKTKGIPDLPEGQLYIKRLVAIGGDHVRIGNDQHLIINGKRLDASTPHYEHVYSFPSMPKEGEYFGHVNEVVGRRFGRYGLAPLFHDETCEHVVAPHHFLAMGDNTLNSYDSRAWGDVPCENVIGKCWFVYWPFTKRFGWGTR